MTPDAAPASGRDAGFWRVPDGEFAAFSDAGETILYSRTSARTIYLDPAATLLFEVLSAAPLPLGALIESLAARWEVDPAEIDPDAVSRMLGALRESGVVEPVPPCA